MAFRGTFDHTLDAKNRLTVPARYRSALADGVVLAMTIDQRPCVGQEVAGGGAVERELRVLLVVLQRGPAAVELGLGCRGRPGVGGVVPEEALQRGMHQGSLDRVGGRRLGETLDLRVAEGQRAVGEGNDFRRAQRAWKVERHAVRIRRGSDAAAHPPEKVERA